MSSFALYMNRAIVILSVVLLSILALLFYYNKIVFMSAFSLCLMFLSLSYREALYSVDLGEYEGFSNREGLLENKESYLDGLLAIVFLLCFIFAASTHKIFYEFFIDFFIWAIPSKYAIIHVYGVTEKANLILYLVLVSFITFTLILSSKLGRNYNRLIVKEFYLPIYLIYNFMYLLFVIPKDLAEGFIKLIDRFL